MKTSFCQVIDGSVKFLDGNSKFSLVNVRIGENLVPCDSHGGFKFNGIINADTIEITPYPAYVKVIIINYPKNIDSLKLYSIPFFENVNKGIPMINFKNKRASKKYYKKLEKAWHIEEEELILKINHSRYIWNGKAMKVTTEKNNGILTVILNLKC